MKERWREGEMERRREGEILVSKFSLTPSLHRVRSFSTSLSLRPSVPPSLRPSVPPSLRPSVPPSLPPPSVTLSLPFDSPLDNLQEERLLLVDYLEESYVQTEIRSFAGDTRPAHPENARARADAWLGDHPANPANLRRGTPGQPGIALSSAAAPGAAGMD